MRYCKDCYYFSDNYAEVNQHGKHQNCLHPHSAEEQINLITGHKGRFFSSAYRMRYLQEYCGDNANWFTPTASAK